MNNKLNNKNMTKKEYEQYKLECDQMCNCPYLKIGKVVIGTIVLGLIGMIVYHGVVLGGFTNNMSF